MFPFDPEESNSLPPSLPPPPSSLLSFEFSMANPNHTAVVGDPPTIGEYVRELPRAVVMDYVKSPPRFLLHFVLGGLLFYLQLEAGREGKNQRWFQPQAQAQAQPPQPQPQLQQQLDAVHQAQLDLTIRTQTLANAQAAQEEANMAQIQAQEALLESLVGFHVQIHMPIKVLFKQLKCTKEGLTSEDAANRLQIFGPNKLEEKKVATLIAVYANWGFAGIKGVGWGWAGVIWLYSLVSYLPLDLIKIFVRNVLNGKAPDFAEGKDYGREEREAQSPLAQRTLHGLQPLETSNLFSNKSNYLVQAESAEQAKRPVEVVQGFLSCTQGNVESAMDIERA
ncbi:hypothetical protein MRB53_012446 [Persea americana]|uniref:Uncharacterized protein n=1 Tax=Persea americana TaxID=3435 RepID=A0ACC2LXY1_PERAE|nr:hypothetical protein MRB53_012446 [Persea americana]